MYYDRLPLLRLSSVKGHGKDIKLKQRGMAQRSGFLVGLTAYASLQAIQLFLPVLEHFRVTASIRVMLLAHATGFLDLMYGQHQLQAEGIDLGFT